MQKHFKCIFESKYSFYRINNIIIMKLFETENIFQDFGFEIYEESSYCETLDLGIFNSLEEGKKKAESLGLKHYYIKGFKY